MIVQIDGQSCWRIDVLQRSIVQLIAQIDGRSCWKLGKKLAEKVNGKRVGRDIERDLADLRQKNWSPSMRIVCASECSCEHCERYLSEA